MPPEPSFQRGDARGHHTHFSFHMYIDSMIAQYIWLYYNHRYDVFYGHTMTMGW